MRQLELVEESRRLADKGWNYKAIASHLHVSDQIVNKWCGGLTDIRVGKIVEALQKKRLGFFNQDLIYISKLTDENARLLVSLLYWCEGAKYPSSNRVEFVCSDKDLVDLFLLLFRKGFPVDESKLRVMLQIHSSHNTEEVTKYWSEALNIPTKQFTKPTITTKNGGKYRKMYMGTCSVRYHDYKFLLRIMGIYTHFCKDLVSRYCYNVD